MFVLSQCDFCVPTWRFCTTRMESCKGPIVILSQKSECLACVSVCKPVAFVEPYCFGKCIGFEACYLLFWNNIYHTDERKQFGGKTFYCSISCDIERTDEIPSCWEEISTFTMSILKSLVIPAIGLALSGVIYYRITLFFCSKSHLIRSCSKSRHFCFKPHYFRSIYHNFCQIQNEM